MIPSIRSARWLTELLSVALVLSCASGTQDTPSKLDSFQSKNSVPKVNEIEDEDLSPTWAPHPIRGASIRTYKSSKVDDSLLRQILLLKPSYFSAKARMSTDFDYFVYIHTRVIGKAADRDGDTVTIEVEPEKIPVAEASAVVDVDTSEAYGLSGGPWFTVDVVLCDPKRTTSLIQTATQQFLTKSAFEIEYPGWNEAGFLFAHKETHGEVFVDRPLVFEEIKLFVKIDEKPDKLKDIITIIYEINAGPRKTDRSSWSNRSDSTFATTYINKLQWRISNIVQTSFDWYCRQINSTSERGGDPATRVLKRLDKKQQQEVSRRLKTRR